MQYVYRYVKNKNVMYVGITNNMRRRVREHKQDKLSSLDGATVQYFAVKTRADAELLETYLINHYKTGEHFNVSKTKKGEVSFLGDLSKLPWVEYNGKIERKMPCFTINDLFPKSKTEVKIVKAPVLPKGASEDQILDDFYRQEEELRKWLDDDEESSRKIVQTISLALDPKFECVRAVSEECLLEGLTLYTEYLGVLKEIRGEQNKPIIPLDGCETRNFTKLVPRLCEINSKLEKHKERVETEYKEWCESQTA
jgi:hypothetical protein